MTITTVISPHEHSILGYLSSYLIHGEANILAPSTFVLPRQRVGTTIALTIDDPEEEKTFLNCEGFVMKKGDSKVGKDMENS